MDKLGERTEANAEMFEIADSQLNSLKNAFENFLWTNNGCGPASTVLPRKPDVAFAALEKDGHLPCEKEVECDAHIVLAPPRHGVRDPARRASCLSPPWRASRACSPARRAFKGEEVDGNPHELSELLKASPVDAFAKLSRRRGRRRATLRAE